MELVPLTDVQPLANGAIKELLIGDLPDGTLKAILARVIHISGTSYPPHMASIEYTLGGIPIVSEIGVVYNFGASMYKSVKWTGSLPVSQNLEPQIFAKVSNYSGVAQVAALTAIVETEK